MLLYCCSIRVQSLPRGTKTERESKVVSPVSARNEDQHLVVVKQCILWYFSGCSLSLREDSSASPREALERSSSSSSQA